MQGLGRGLKRCTQVYLHQKRCGKVVCGGTLYLQKPVWESGVASLQVGGGWGVEASEMEGPEWQSVSLGRELRDRGSCMLIPLEKNVSTDGQRG